MNTQFPASFQYTPEDLQNTANKYESSAAQGLYSHEQAIKIYQFFENNHFQNNLRTINCKFSESESFNFNFILFHSCRVISKKENAIHHKINPYFLLNKDDKELLIQVDKWMKTGKLDEFILLERDCLEKIVVFCDKYNIDILKNEINLIYNSDILLNELWQAFSNKDAFSLNLVLEKINNTIPYISFELQENFIKIYLTPNKSIHQDLSIKRFLKGFAEFLLKNNYGIFIELLESINLEISYLLYDFIQYAEIKIHKMKIQIDLYTKENINLLNLLLLLVPNLSHLHVISEGNIENDDILEQFLIASPSMIEYFGIKGLNHLKERHLLEFFKKFGVHLKHFFFQSQGKFSDSLLNALVKYCPHLEILYLDFEDQNSDVSKESLFDLFESCKQLKIIRLYNSIHSPPCQIDGYDLGIINLLQKGFPERILHINYEYFDE